MKEMDTKLASAAPNQKQLMQTARDTLDITFIDKTKLEQEFIDAFGLFELKLQLLQERHMSWRNENRYNDLPL